MSIVETTKDSADDISDVATNTGASAGYLASIVQAFVAAITALRVYITNWPQPASGEAALELTGLAADTTRYDFDLVDSGYLSYSANVHTIANVTFSVWYTNDAAATVAADAGWEKDDDLGDQTTAIGWFRKEPWARMMIKVISTGAGTIDCHITRAP